MPQDGVEAGVTEDDLDPAFGGRIFAENRVELFPDGGEHLILYYRSREVGGRIHESPGNDSGATEDYRSNVRPPLRGLAHPDNLDTGVLPTTQKIFVSECDHQSAPALLSRNSWPIGHAGLVEAQIAGALLIPAREPVHAFAGKVTPDGFLGHLSDVLPSARAISAAAVRTSSGRATFLVIQPVSSAYRPGGMAFDRRSRSSAPREERLMNRFEDHSVPVILASGCNSPWPFKSNTLKFVIESPLQCPQAGAMADDPPGPRWPASARAKPRLGATTV